MILSILVFGVYTFGIGLFVGLYFGNNSSLSVLPIFACDICSSDIFISKLTLYCLIL